MEKFISLALETIKGVSDRLSARIDAIEQRAAVAGPRGEQGVKGDRGEPGKAGEPGAAGKDGRDVAPDELKALVVAHVDERVAGLPVPRDGKSVTVDDVAPFVAELLEQKFAALPAPIAGKDGRDGVDGKDGLDGIGVVGPAGEKGPKGDPGADGRDGREGVKGEKGEAGTRGEKGIDGKDGLDGLGFDDLNVTHDGERGFTFAFTKGDRVKSFSFTVPIALYRGIYKEGETYERGDTTTWGGSLWHANESTTSKPGLATAESRAWQLCVKKGTDGKEGRSGKDGAPGPKGDKGDRGYGG